MVTSLTIRSHPLTYHSHTPQRHSDCDHEALTRTLSRAAGTEKLTSVVTDTCETAAQLIANESIKDVWPLEYMHGANVQAPDPVVQSASQRYRL